MSRHHDLNTYINKYQIFESKQYNYKNNYIIDLATNIEVSLKILEMI